MSDFNIVIEGGPRTMRTFQELAKRVKDLNPVWTKFLVFYKKTVIPGAFNTKGKIMGKAWAPYSESYAKTLASKGLTTDVTLERSKKLRKAAQGGAGWFQILQKLDLEFGVKDIKYSRVHQMGYKNIPQRPYFVTVKEDLPKRAWAFLLKETNAYIEAADK